jgi:hypothetical protein
MAKKPTTKMRRTLTAEQFHNDRRAVIAAAKKPGGVDVINADGSVLCHVSIPHAALPEFR